MRGDRDCCLLDQSHVHAHTVQREDPIPVDPMNMPMDPHHEQMSDMDMEDGSMDMGETRAPVAQQNSGERTNNLTARIPSNEQATAESNEPCPHCLMHSQLGERFPITVAENSAPDQVIPADTSATSLNTVSSPLAIVELRDHSPPGSLDPLYVLISSFRI
jgi:hypothetical protein